MVLEEIPTAEQTAVQHKHERKGSNGLIKHERRRSVSIENPEAEIAKGKVSRRKSVDASNAAEQQQQQHTAPTSPASTSTSTSPTPTAEKKSKRRYSIQEETEGDVADVETEKSERRNSAGSSSGSRRKNSIQEEDDKSERRGRRRSIQEEGSFEEKTERRSRRRDSIQEESQDPEEKDKADRKGRRGSIKEDGKEKEKEKKKVERRRSLKPEESDKELIKAPVKEIKEEQEEEEEPVFKTLAERKAALQAHVVKSAVVPKSSPAIVERELEIEETQRVKLTEKLRIQREEEIAREDFQLMIELYIRILFELEIQGTWQELTEKGVVNQPWDEIEGKLYQDPKLNSIADNNNDEWTELKIRIFEMRHTLSELYEIFLTSFSLQVYADVFSLVEVLMTDEVQARCKQSWYQRRYTAWAQANVEVPLIFLMDLPEIAAIAEVMFDAMDYNTRQKFVDIVFDNSNGTVRSVIEKNLQKRRASAVNKFMGEISQISHRAVGFVVNTANAMQKVLKKDEKEPTKATLTVPEKGRKFSRPMSRDEIAQFMYGDDNEDLLGTMNENPLFRKSLSHMRLGELASSKADLPISAPSPIKQSLTQEILNNPTQIESLNQFTAVDQLFVELQSSVVDFLAHPELQGPEFEPMRKRVQSNLEELKKYQIEPAPMPEIIIDAESLSGDDFDEEFEQPLQGKPNDVLDKAFSNFSQPATQVAPAKEPKTKKSKSGKHWKNMKNRVKGLLSAGNKESNGYSSEFDSNMELDKIAKGEKSGK